MIYQIDISIEDALQLHHWHYQYGADYKSTTILMDANGYIISYIDRHTSSVFVIKLNTIHKGEWYFANQKFVKGRPFKFFHFDINKINKIIPKEERGIVRQAIYDYNINFFIGKIKKESIDILEKLKKSMNLYNQSDIKI